MFSFLSFKNNRTFFLFYCIFILHFIAGSVSVLCFSPREQISLDLWDKQQYVRVFKLRKAGFSEQWVSNRVVSSDWSKSVWVTFSLASNLANQEWAFWKSKSLPPESGLQNICQSNASNIGREGQQATRTLRHRIGLFLRWITIYISWKKILALSRTIKNVSE